MNGDGAPDRTAATAQLAALQAGRAGLADRVVQPWWWDVLLGLLLFVFVGSYSAHDARVVLGAVVLLVGGLSGLVAVYRRITGVWFDARRVGPAQEQVRRLMRLWGAVYVGLMTLGGAVEFLLGVRGTMVVVGAVLGLSVAVASRSVTRLYVVGLRSAP